ncbi:MAG: M28 family peptidase [Planctomyces sp.]
MSNFHRFSLSAMLVTCAFMGAMNEHSRAGSLNPQQPETKAAPPDVDPAKERNFLRNIRQMTFEGRRAGESYFSADGRKMVFQSEREPGNPFFQIYLLDRDSGETIRVSPGKGKTTCAWIHPNGEKVLFASTQDDPQAEQEQKDELALRESGKERRYSWDYDEFYELYEYTIATGEYHRLTESRGYDAEASWSPDGNWIAFASNRGAYERVLTEAEQKSFDQDPAWGNDIWIMKSDGSELKQLTKSPGYDGGPFFSPDGKRICWRRFSENGATAEIMTMNVDGSDELRLTQLDSMSWAPFYHPSGRYLIFTTNRHGFANFELYLVDVKGQHEPVRVTQTAGFDGLPVFTPDGKQLAWTTNRTGSQQSQIFLADWNHQQALKSLNLGTEASETNAVAGSHPDESPKTVGSAVRAQYSPADALRHVEYLCRPQLGGRLTGTRGEILATNYVALHFETLGLIPAGDNDTWFQEFEFTSGVSAGSGNEMLVDGKPLQLNSDWKPLAFSTSGPVSESEVVFAGYGIQAPAGDGFEEYDSYVHLDVKDKWVLTFRFLPENFTPQQRQYFTRFSSLRFKAMKARDLGARGLIVVSGPTSGVKEQLIPLQFDGALAGSGLPVVSVTDKVAADLLSHSGKDLKALQEKLDQGDPVMGFPVKEAKILASIQINHEKKKGRNVLARLQLGDAPAGQIVVVGAHIDHLGTGPSGNSLARDEEQQQIHFGADDNASGVAAMMQIAEAMKTSHDNGTLTGQRDIVFAAWSGEELGLLGSSHYVKTLETLFSQHAAGFEEPAPKAKEPSESPSDGSASEKAKEPSEATVPPENSEKSDGASEAKQDSTGPNTGGLNLYIAACLNMDIVGRMQEQLVLQGIGSSLDWQKLIEKANAPLSLALSLQDDSYIPTDASVFFMHGVPILSAFTGNHGEYHTPRDTPEKLNYEGITSVARLMDLVCRQLIARERGPLYVSQDRPKEGQRRAALRAYLGTIPDYAQTDAKGVLLSGVAKGGPAANAGVLGGDIIIKLAGKQIENIYDYTYAIEALKAGQEVELVVRRGDKEVVTRVTPGSRD